MGRWGTYNFAISLNKLPADLGEAFEELVLLLKGSPDALLGGSSMGGGCSLLLGRGGGALGGVDLAVTRYGYLLLYLSLPLSLRLGSLVGFGLEDLLNCKLGGFNLSLKIVRIRTTIR